MIYLSSVVFFICVASMNLSLVRATYEDDQKALLLKFGKAAILEKPEALSICQIKKEFTEIMQRNCKGERKKREELIAKQMELKLIGWATVYQAKPSGTLLHNVEFDHIPPGSAHPFEYEGPREEMFKLQAPTLAISNYDHRSALWKQCSTTSGGTSIMKKYKEFVEEGNYMCAIFANIFCIKDIEKKIAKIERISETSAFERYKDGFKSLINLHYDFGRENNGVISFNAKVSSAYCSISINPRKPPRDARTGCKPEKLIKEEGSVWYCKNVGADYRYCRFNERNMKKSEYDLLNDWIDLTKTDGEMLDTCGMTEDEWRKLFPKIKWDYDPEADPNAEGDEDSCVQYERKWMKTEAEIKADRIRAPKRKRPVSDIPEEDEGAPKKKPKLDDGVKKRK